MDISEGQLRRHVDERYIDRGRDYFRRGRTVLDQISEHRVSATCSGGRFYRITLTASREQLDSDCTCPAFTDFGPCKHIAATALAVMAHREGRYTASHEAMERAGENRHLRERLLAMDKPGLVDLILQIAEDDELWWLLDDR